MFPSSGEDYVGSLGKSLALINLSVRAQQSVCLLPFS
jgi:hypothetical protein